MKYRVPVLTFLLLISLLLTSHAVSQTPSESPQRPVYQATGSEATLAGAIVVVGTVPEPRRIDMSADPICVQLNHQPKTEDLITNEGRLENAFVYVKNGAPLNAFRFELPKSEVVLRRQNCRYSPRVVGLRVGQSLVLVNDDPTEHNSHPTPKLNIEWNQTQPPSAPPLVKTIARPELLIPFRCNQHPWEKAYAGVLDHPFFAVSDQVGNYEIRGLPPGTYTLMVWHEKLGEQQLEVTLVPGETRNADFTFDADKKP